VFAWSDRAAYASVNFVTAHDGYTLRDLVTYERKHNEANGEGNRDGHDDNLSRNWGHEGETKSAKINAARRRAVRNMLATLAFSQGVPMLSHGDEVGRTQKGNNNAYAQDNGRAGWTGRSTTSGAPCSTSRGAWWPSATPTRCCGGAASSAGGRSARRASRTSRGCAPTAAR
jgi:glycogen operon protein